LIFSGSRKAIVSENKERDVFGQAVRLVTFTRAEARARFAGHHVDRLCNARPAVVVCLVANRVRHYKPRGLGCQRFSRMSLPQRLLDHRTVAKAPEARASASEPGFFCEHCGRRRRRDAPLGAESAVPRFQALGDEPALPGLHTRSGTTSRAQERDGHDDAA
jgi:hypothetical protein